MGLHHLALATRDIDATHRFYTEVMGFRLAKVVAGPLTAGFAKHAFYDTGDGGYIAFWDIHDATVGAFPPGLRNEGLPPGTNHLAFTAHSPDELEAHRRRWLDHGLTLVEVDHGFCRSIYSADPDGTTVEFCLMTRVLDEQDRDEAERLLADPAPPLDPPLTLVVHRPEPVGAPA